MGRQKRKLLFYMQKSRKWNILERKSVGVDAGESDRIREIYQRDWNKSIDETEFCCGNQIGRDVKKKRAKVLLPSWKFLYAHSLIAACTSAVNNAPKNIKKDNNKITTALLSFQKNKKWIVT